MELVRWSTTGSIGKKISIQSITTLCYLFVLFVSFYCVVIVWYCVCSRTNVARLRRSSTGIYRTLVARLLKKSETKHTKRDIVLIALCLDCIAVHKRHRSKAFSERLVALARTWTTAFRRSIRNRVSATSRSQPDAIKRMVDLHWLEEKKINE